MKLGLRQKINIKSHVLLACIFLMACFLVVQQVGAANTFSPYQYDLVSVNNVDGQGIDRHGDVNGVSFDGSKILFSTTATNLPNATSNTLERGAYLRDIVGATTTRVDLSQSGTVPDKSAAGDALSVTGRYVVFSSTASNIIDGMTLDNSVNRIYFKDLQTNTVELITNISNVSSGGYPGWFSASAVSDDGRYILITTNVVNSILPGIRSNSNSNYRDIVLYDRGKTEWTLINKPVDGIMQGVTTSSDYYKGASANCDGSLVVFNSAATNLTDNHSGSGKHVFLADIRNGLHITDLTQGATADNVNPQVSCNGRYIIYSTKDRTVITPTPTGMDTYAHLVRYDRLTGERKYIDSATNNTTFDTSQSPNISAAVSDTGDVILAYGNTSSKKVYFKHLSDGSGTLEPVQHNFGGLIDDGRPLAVSANGKYVIVSSPNGQALGVLTQASSWQNILRIKTGL